MVVRLPSPRIAGLLFALVAVPVVGIEAWASRGEEQIQSEEMRSQDIESAQGEIRQRIDAKRMMVGELIAGHITLADVTARFLVLNRDRSEYMGVIRTAYPGATDEEKMARNVLSFVDAELAGVPAPEQTEVMTRLEAELSQIVDSDDDATE